MGVETHATDQHISTDHLVEQSTDRTRSQQYNFDFAQETQAHE